VYESRLSGAEAAPMQLGAATLRRVVQDTVARPRFACRSGRQPRRNSISTSTMATVRRLICKG
jgi:hypothetical protein